MRGSWIIAAVLGSSFGCGSGSDTKGEADTPGKTASRDAESEPKASKDAEPDQPPAPKLPEPKLIEPIGEPEVDQAIAVALPPTPDFPEVEARETYPDGAYSIAGLRRKMEERIGEGTAGTDIVVKGWVAKIYVAPECPEGEVCPPAKQPHVWVTDGEGERGLKRAMLVVNYRFQIPEWQEKDWRGQPEVVLELGHRYAFKGKFKRFSDTGFAHEKGLLEFVGVRNLDESGNEVGDWVYPPGAPWHPLEIARQEEMNRELMERARRAGH